MTEVVVVVVTGIATLPGLHSMMLAPLVAVGSGKVIPALAGEDVMVVEATVVSTDAEDGTNIEPAIVAAARATTIAF